MDESWKKFQKTGKIIDYLEYKKRQREAEENGKNRRDNSKDNRV